MEIRETDETGRLVATYVTSTSSTSSNDKNGPRAGKGEEGGRVDVIVRAMSFPFSTTSPFLFESWPVVQSPSTYANAPFPSQHLLSALPRVWPAGWLDRPWGSRTQSAQGRSIWASKPYLTLPYFMKDQSIKSHYTRPFPSFPLLPIDIHKHLPCLSKPLEHPTSSNSHWIRSKII